MRPSKLIIQNFKTFKNETIDFPLTDENILILGDNRDSMGQDSNGAGKTSLFDSISIAFFGKIPKGGYVDDIIRTGTNQLTIEGHFSNGSDTLKIIRKRGSENSLQYWVNGSDDHPRSTQTITQRALLEYLGINPDNKDYYTDFVNTTYFSVDSLKAFASKETSSEEKMKLITRMLNLERLELATKDVRKRRQKVEQKLNGKLNILTNINSSISNTPSAESCKKQMDTIHHWVDEAKAKIVKWEEEIEQTKLITPLESSLSELKSKINLLHSSFKNKLDYFKSTYAIKEERTRSLIELQDRKKEIEKEVKALPKLDEVTNSIEELELNIVNLGSKELNFRLGINQLESKIKLNNQLIRKALSCPECKTNLMVSSDSSLKKFDKQIIEDKVTKDETDLLRIREKLFKVGKEKGEYSVSLGKYREIKSQLTQLFNEVKTIKLNPNEVRDIEIELNTLDKQKDAVTAEFNYEYLGLLEKKKELEEKLKETEEHKVDIKKLKADIKNTQDHIASLHAQKGELIQGGNHREELETHRSKLNRNIKSTRNVIGNFLLIEECYITIRRWKIESFLPEFENISNKYVKDMKCGYQISLDTVKEKKSAKKDENKYKLGFTINIIDECGYIRNIDTFSTGEGTRIAICLGLALREIAKQRSNMPFEFVLLDDIAGGIDESGGEQLVKILNNISGLKMVITQNNHLAKNFVNVINVIKENGISTVEKEETK